MVSPGPLGVSRPPGTRANPRKVKPAFLADTTNPKSSRTLRCAPGEPNSVLVQEVDGNRVGAPKAFPDVNRGGAPKAFLFRGPAGRTCRQHLLLSVDRPGLRAHGRGLRSSPSLRHGRFLVSQPSGRPRSESGESGFPNGKQEGNLRGQTGPVCMTAPSRILFASRHCLSHLPAPWRLGDCAHGRRLAAHAIVSLLACRRSCVQGAAPGRSAERSSWLSAGSAAA